jgi:hypothetical protein
MFSARQSKFDDYYEFEVGRVSAGSRDEECFTRFTIVRPMREGVRPSVDNGYSAFEDVRGESGTRVTIRLNQRAVDAGLLDEDKLRHVLAKILETSQYTVAFSSDEDAQDVIDASQKEDAAVLAAVEPLEAAASEISLDPVQNGHSKSC